MLKVTEKWQEHYPNAMKSWSINWGVIIPIFKFSVDARKVIYTTNAIESLNRMKAEMRVKRSISCMNFTYTDLI
jgi:transposase-like protein